MDPAKILAAPKEVPLTPALAPSDGPREKQPLVRLIVWEAARNPHVVYAYLAEEVELAQKTGAPAATRPLWPVRLRDVSNAGFRRGMELGCVHLGSGYYEFRGQTPAS